MSKIVLPARYYHAHAEELFSYIEIHCTELLTDSSAQFLNNYRLLSVDAQCLLIRILSRKPLFIKTLSLNYDEIPNSESALDELLEYGLIERINRTHLGKEFFLSLTKPELLQFLSDHDTAPSKQSAKQVLVDTALNYLRAQDATKHNLSCFKTHIARAEQEPVEYLLFLFFGHLKQGFNAFTMRDLGVMRTQQTRENHAVARFRDKQHALLEFNCVKHLQALRQDSPNVEKIHQFLLDNQGCNSPAFNKLCVRLGEAFADQAPDTAINIWGLGHCADALEKRIRLSYRTGDKLEVKNELEALREKSLNSASEIFIEDFYARKYAGAKRSIFTQILREQSSAITLDEAYLNAVEKGVAAHYARAGRQVSFTENSVWRTCFALLFWDILMEGNGSYATEFDRLPLKVIDGSFYSSNTRTIESRLADLDTPEKAIARATINATQKHGCSNGFFRWSSKTLDDVIPLMQYSPPGSLSQIMRRMAQDYFNTNDGYPDLMLVHEQKLEFIEVKAPGDVLRPNQLVSINRLRRAGYTVNIQTVHWAIDPDQIYSVVDIETTGAKKDGNAITEIAVVQLKEQTIVSEWSSLIRPNKPIPRHITHLTGITNEMVSSAPRFSEIADELSSLLQGTIFVAHNVAFDYGFIKAAYEQLGQRFSLPKMCTVRSSRATFPGLKSYSLGNLTRHFDIDLHNHHRALDDARATAHLLSLIQEAKHHSQEQAKTVA